jgi:hypothetical protein
MTRVTTLQARRPENRGSISSGSRKFLFTTGSRSTLECSQPPIGKRDFSAIKRPKPEATPMAKKDWSYACTRIRRPGLAMGSSARSVPIRFVEPFNDTCKREK